MKYPCTFHTIGNSDVWNDSTDKMQGCLLVEPSRHTTDN